MVVAGFSVGGVSLTALGSGRRSSFGGGALYTSAGKGSIGLEVAITGDQVMFFDDAVVVAAVSSLDSTPNFDLCHRLICMNLVIFSLHTGQLIWQQQQLV